MINNETSTEKALCVQAVKMDIQFCFLGSFANIYYEIIDSFLNPLRPKMFAALKSWDKPHLLMHAILLRVKSDLFWANTGLKFFLSQNMISPPLQRQKSLSATSLYIYLGYNSWNPVCTVNQPDKCNKCS